MTLNPVSNIAVSQIIFDGFTVGRFDEGIADNEFETTDVSLMLSASGAELPGCPDGFMQVWDRVSNKKYFELSSHLFYPLKHNTKRQNEKQKKVP